MLGMLVCYGRLRAGNAGAALSPFGIEVLFLSNQTETVQVYSELWAPTLRNLFLVDH